jgi:GNAT superfamily N-acetyltransferase
VLELRTLKESDAEELEAFLVQHRDTSMFLRSNARRAGLTYAGQRLQATYVGRFQDGEMVGVVAHAWNGLLLLQAPADGAAIAQRCIQVSRRAVSGLAGPASQVRECRIALGLAGAPATLEEDEDLYALDLAGWVMPPALTGDAVTGRAPLESERELLRAWRHAFEVEANGRRPDDVDVRARADTMIDEQIADGVAFVTVFSGTPVSYAAFNAVLPDIVQLGGVYTPHERRGRGYAKAVVAYSVSVARQRGAERAVLFTNNPSAARSYEAVGFRRVGDYGVVLFA